MRVLIVHSHPDPDSYNASLCRTVAETLTRGGHELRVIDLYAEGFQPVLSREGWRAYEDAARNADGIEDHVAALRWAEGLIFVYPTWWYGLPAMLKGWLDRVWTPGVAFTLPKDGPIAPSLTHIRKLGVVTTCGASWWLTQVVGAPGRNLMLRGCRFLMAPRCKRLYLAHYRMDASTPQSREKFRARVRRAMARF
ncbi:MAG: NAD(P)H dehydrogenase [Rhodobacterales bacterium CG18_big_fil_WC_8_21_14_2_50_71_9]|nr:MAG: NAD(P)H dehydrogenase [Rhodobacterales bacterium CG18_big_fil_WC_8_21_14_2_50_71_9]